MERKRLLISWLLGTVACACVHAQILAESRFDSDLEGWMGVG